MSAVVFFISICSIALRKLHCSCMLSFPSIPYWSSELESASPKRLSTSSMMSRASSSIDSNSLRDIFASLPRRLDDVLESSRVDEAPAGNEGDERRRLMGRGRLEELHSESLLGWSGMLLEGFGRKSG
jgi:hypothetical protein